MIDLNYLKYDGRQRNHQNGLTFYFSRNAQVLNFLIDVIGDRKRKIRVTMYPDISHGRAHVHINEHGASFAVDNGELLAGNADPKTCKMMGNWIDRHRGDLLQLWDLIKRGEVYEPVVEKIKREKTFQEFGFGGAEPRRKTTIDGVVIWHDDELLVEHMDDGRLLVVGTEDMYVVLPEGYPVDFISIESLSGSIIFRRGI